MSNVSGGSTDEETCGGSPGNFNHWQTKRIYICLRSLTSRRTFFYISMALQLTYFWLLEIFCSSQKNKKFFNSAFVQLSGLHFFKFNSIIIPHFSTAYMKKWKHCLYVQSYVSTRQCCMIQKFSHPLSIQFMSLDYKYWVQTESCFSKNVLIFYR